MNIKKGTTASKVLSIVLSLLMVLGTIPVQGMVAYAAEFESNTRTFSVQYLKKDVVQSGVEIKIQPDIDKDNTFSGVTDEYGIWGSDVTWESLSDIFYVYINGEAKTVKKPEKPSKFLIISDDEKKWSDRAMPLVSVRIGADKTEVTRGESFELKVAVTGTPYKYQWYLDSKAIDGANSRFLYIENATLADGGTYTCKVTDLNGDSRTSDKVTVKVYEKTPGKVVLNAYADGKKIDGDISRDSVRKVEIKLEDLPKDAVVSEVDYYINDNCVSSGTKELSYIFEIEDGVEVYDCKARVEFDKTYESVDVDCSVHAPLLTQDEIVITVDGAEYDAETGTYKITYSASPKAEFTVTVSGGSGNGAYKINISDEKDSNGKPFLTNHKVAKLAETPTKNKWEVTIHNAGSFKINASRIGDGDYKEVEPVTVSVNVAKATPEGFAFVTETPEAVTYNENGNKFSNPVVDGFSGVVYSIEDGDCATIDQKTGELTITKAGTVTVKAVLAGDRNYEEATATYTLTVNKAAQNIAFEEKAETIFYGESYSRVATPVKVETAADGFGYNHDEGVKIEYSIDDETVASVNEDGSLTFKDFALGTVNVKASIAGNDCYEAAEVTYNLTVEAYTVENGYSVSGEKLIADGAWYSGDITITPAENHLIGMSDSLGENAEWAQSIVIDTEGTENGIEFYIKNIETGAITQAYTIASEDLMLDKSAPHSLKVNYQTEAWYQEVLEAVTFGYYNSVVAFTLEANDEYSGVEYFEWKFVSEGSDEDEAQSVRVEATKDGDTYKSELCVLGDENNLQDFRGRISFAAYDYAGNSEESKSFYVIVIDSSEPELDIAVNRSPEKTVNNAYPYEDADENSVEPIDVYNDEITVAFSIIEKNFFEKNAVILVNDEDVSGNVEWIAAGDNHYAELELDKDGDYRIELTYNDIFGDDPSIPEVKKSYSTSDLLCIDKTPSVISLEMSEAQFENDGVKYYNGDVEITITVDEEKFRPSEIDVSNADEFIGIGADNKTYLADSSHWTYDEENGTYSASVVVEAEDADGIYSFVINHSDLANNAAEAVESGTFVIDTIVPETGISTETEPEKTVINAYPYADAEKDADSTIDIFSDDTKVIFTLVEKNFFEDRAVITVNGETEDDIEWISDGDKRTAEIVLDEENDYQIDFAYSDIFGESVNASDLICIDKTSSVVSLEMSEAQFENDGIKYYNDDVEVTITVDDEKFRPSEISVSDAEGFIGIGEDNEAYLADSDNWNYNEENGTYSASVVIEAEDADGVYSFVINHSDLANNAAEAVESGTFVIDTIVPETGISTETEPEETVINIYPYADAEKDADSTIDIFSNDTKVIFTLVEKNFFEDRAVITVNGKTQNNIEWNSEGDKRTAEIVFDEEDDYEINLKYTDIFGDGAEKAEYVSSDLISVDKTVPEITIELNDAETVNESISYYKSDVIAKITVKEEKFRPSEFVISEAEELIGMSAENKQYLLDAGNWQYDEESKSYCATVVFATENAEGVYKFAADYEDIANYSADQVLSDTFVIDVTAPVITVDYGAARILDSDNLPLADLNNIDSNNVTIYDNKDIVVTVTIKETNFDPAKVTAMLSKNFKEAKAYDFDGEWVSDGDIHTNTITLSEKDVYRLNITCIDRSNNKSDEYVSPKIDINDSVPSITFDVSPVSEDGYYKKDSVDVTVKIFDEYFAQEKVDIKIETVDLDGKKIELDINDIIPDYNDIEWTSGENFCNSLVFTFATEGRYSITVDYSNAVDISDKSVCEFVLDRTAPTHEVTYSESIYQTIFNTITFRLFNSSKSEVKVTVKATDMVSGVDRMFIEYSEELKPEEYYGVENIVAETEFVNPSEKDEKVFEETWIVNAENATVQAKANIKVTVTDNAGNVTAEEDRIDSGNEIGIDNVSSTISMSYGNAVILNSDNVEIEDFEENEKNNVTIYDNKNIVVTVTVNEPNFNPEKAEAYLSLDYAEAQKIDFDGEWVSDGFVHTNTVTISGEGVYKLTVNNTDYAENEATYTSAMMVISESKPMINIVIEPARAIDYYNETVYMDVKVFDEFFSSDRVNLIVTAADAKFNEPIYELSEWRRTGTSTNTATLTFAQEGRYNVKVEYTNAVDESTWAERSFVVDFTAPVISSDIKNSDDEVNNGATFYVKNNFLDKNSEGKVVLNASDYDFVITSKNISGTVIENAKDVTEFIKNPANWTTEWSQSENAYISSITISGFDDARYTITVTGKDKALNEADQYTTKEFIVDSTAPYEVKIQYSEPISIGTSTNGKSTSEIRYYNNKIKVTLSATDSTSGVVQFNWEYKAAAGASTTNAQTLSGVCFLDVSSDLVTDETSTKTAEFYLPADKLQEIRGSLTVTATDRLGNVSEPFKDSTVLVIDTVKPEIEFEYNPTDPKRSDGDYKDGGTAYYDSAVTVSVFVKDANFAEDAKSIKNTNKSIYNGAVILCNGETYAGSWTKTGDIWRTDIELPNDGSYVISAEYSDPSGNKADSKESGTLIVDRTAPVIEVVYSPDKPVYTESGRSYYNEDQTATITITERNFDPADIISSVTVQNIGESQASQTDIAAALLNESTWKQEGDVYTATIKYATDGNYRFDIEYTDPSGNKAEEYAGSEFTVDKSAPTDVSIDFSKEINSEDGTLYYDAPVKVTLTAKDTISGVNSFEYSYTSSVNGEITKDTIKANANGATARAEFYIPSSEAKQFKGTVKASATDNSGNKSSAADGGKTIVFDNIAPDAVIDLGTAVTSVNGTSYFASDVNATITVTESNFNENDVVIYVDGNSVGTRSWTNNGDAWTTTVNVSSDGQHKISVSYTDKSGNQMQTQESDDFVIDHTAPVIVVNGIKNKAAYSDDQIGFTVTAQDANFSAAGLEAKLTAVVQTEDGKFVTKNIDIKNAYSTSGGYSINVSNLEEDGIYTLSCTASDLCGNRANGLSVDGRTESTIVFSVNRNGSTFDIDDNTKQLISGRGYTQTVNGDVVITETNVAPIETHSVKINGIELGENDYDMRPAGSDGEWYRYVYTIYASNFAEENDYSIVISSTDGTKNTGYSDLKGRPIEFTVDKTAPTVSVSGIEANGSYKTDKLTVSVAPFDAGGMIQKLEIFADNESIAVYSGDELLDILNSSDGKLTVDINEGTYDRIRFVCTDEAGNVYDSENTYTDIAVSPNQLVLLWSRDWFKAVTIGGTLLVAGLIVFIVLKKKKKDE